MLQDILVALAVASSFWLGQLLYLWAREEVDAFRKSIAEKKKREFSKLIPWYNSILYAGVLGFAQAVAPKLQSFEIMSMVLFAVGLILWSVVYADKDMRKSLKGLLLSTSVFLVAFGITYVVFSFYV